MAVTSKGLRIRAGEVRLGGLDAQAMISLLGLLRLQVGLVKEDGFGDKVILLGSSKLLPGHTEEM